MVKTTEAQITNLNQAIQALETLLVETQRAGQRGDQACALLMLVDAHIARESPGDPEQAKGHHHQAVELFEEIGAPGYIVVARERLSTLGEKAG